MCGEVVCASGIDSFPSSPGRWRDFDIDRATKGSWEDGSMRCSDTVTSPGLILTWKVLVV